MRIRVIVPVLHSDELVGKAKEEYQAWASPGVELSVACVANGTRSIESEYDMALAQPDVIRLAREAEKDGVDACTIACFGDPGSAGAKEAVSIPVIGEGEAAMHCASLLGNRFSVVITERAIFPLVHRLVRGCGMESRFASVREVGAGVLDFSLELRAARDRRICRGGPRGWRRCHRHGLHRHGRRHGARYRGRGQAATWGVCAGHRSGEDHYKARGVIGCDWPVAEQGRLSGPTQRAAGVSLSDGLRWLGPNRRSAVCRGAEGLPSQG